MKFLLIHKAPHDRRVPRAWCPIQEDSAHLGTILAEFLWWKESSDILLDDLHKEFEAELETVSRRSPVVSTSEWLFRNTHHLDQDPLKGAFDLSDTDSVKEKDSVVNQDLTKVGFTNDEDDEDDAKKESPHLS